MSMFVRDCVGTDGKGGKEPLVFIHGVGLGVLPYVQFLARMLTSTSRPWIVVEIQLCELRLW